MEGGSIPDVSRFAIPYKDKFAHFTFYLVFSILWFLYFKKNKDGFSNWNLAFYVFLVASVMGMAVEALQYFLTSSRAAEWSDVVANSTGSLFGLAFCFWAGGRRVRK